MKHVSWIASSALLSLALVAVARGQDPVDDPPGGLVPVPPGAADERLAPAAPAAPAADGFDEAAWRERLTQPNLAARLRAFREAVLLVAGDHAAHRAVQAWARGGGELAWTATLLLDEAARAVQPRFGFPFGGPLSPSDPWGGHDPFDGFDPFRGLTPWPPFSPDLGGAGESLRVEQTPEGVRVEVRPRGADGVENVQTYEAPTMDELLRAHPELEGRVGGGLQVQLGEGPFPGLEDLFDRPLPGTLERVPAAVPTDRLGVVVQEPGAWNATRAGVGADEGLLVDEVRPNTIASEMGVRPGEVLVELSGRAVRRRADVAAVLAARAADQEVVAVLVDAEGHRVTRRWRPAR